MDFIDCVNFMLIQDNKVLAEKRKLTKAVDPGAISIPGGHCEEGESPKEALYRETKEELGIVPLQYKYVCTLLHRAEEFQRLYYFAIDAWEGEMGSYEADYLLWVGFDEIERLDLEVDRVAMSEYLRIYDR